MRLLYLGFCALAVLALWRLGTEYTQIVTEQKSAVSEIRILSEHQSFPDTIAFVPDDDRTRPERGIDCPDLNDADESDSDASILTAHAVTEAAAGSLIRQIHTAPPVRHSAPLHDTMITPGNFEYLGAIRMPHVQMGGTSFSFGGWGIAYNAAGDPDGDPDGFPGSLFIVGHQNDQKVAEVTIPRPIVSRLKRIDDLPASCVLRAFEDVTDGLLAEYTAGSSEPFQIGGLHVTGRYLHWTMNKYYNVAGIDYPSHGRKALTSSHAIAEGPWHLGPSNTGRPEWHSYKHAGYVFEIPTNESHQWFGGYSLISGLQTSTGLQSSSQGPAMFAYSLPEAGAPGGSLPAVPLVWYPEEQPLERHHPADRWTGGAWLTLGGKQAVVIAGRKALGAFYYGDARPQDCTPDKGYHGPPYEVQLLFYSPASLIHAANGLLSAPDVRPWFRWDSRAEGGGINQYMFPTCSRLVGGLTYDRDRSLLYLVQVDAGKTSDNEFEPLPVVHVFRIVE